MPRPRITRTVKLGRASNRSFELTTLGKLEAEEKFNKRNDQRLIKRISDAKEERKVAFMKSSAKQAAEDALDWILIKQSSTPKFAV